MGSDFSSPPKLFHADLKTCYSILGDMMSPEIKNSYRNYLEAERCMQPRSVKDYMNVLDLLSQRIDVLAQTEYRPINDRIRTMKEDLGWSQGTVYKCAVCVKHFYKWAHREGYIQVNPYPFTEWKKARPSTPKFLTESQYQSLVDDPHLTHQELTLLHLLWDSGARIGEVVQLTQDQIDLEKGLVVIPYEISKGHYSYRYVPISQTCISFLNIQFGFARRRNHFKAIFLSVNNEPMTVSGLKKVIYSIGLRNSPLRPAMRLSAHMFRHSFGIRMIERGVPQVIVQKWLGHQTLQMTSHYVNMDSESSLRIYNKYATPLSV